MLREVVCRSFFCKYFISGVVARFFIQNSQEPTKSHVKVPKPTLELQRDKLHQGFCRAKFHCFHFQAKILFLSVPDNQTVQQNSRKASKSFMVYVVFWTSFYPTQNKHMQKNMGEKYHISNEEKKSRWTVLTLQLCRGLASRREFVQSLPGGFVGMKGGITNPPEN